MEQKNNFWHYFSWRYSSWRNGAGRTMLMLLKKKIFFLGLLLLLCPIMARAAATGGADNEKENPLKPNFNRGGSVFKFQPFYTYYSYDEYAPANTRNHFMNVNGNMGGVELQWRYVFNNSNAILIPIESALYGSTSITYTGALGDGPYGSAVFHGNRYLIFSFRSLAGYGFAINDNHGINLLTGLAYKLTYNPKSEKYGYDRLNHLFYLPLAVEYQYQYKRDVFSILAHLEYDIFLTGTQYSFLSLQVDNIPNPPTTVVPDTVISIQPKGWGVKTFVELNIYNFLITPFFNYFWVAESSMNINYSRLAAKTTAGGEPENITMEAGIKFGYQF